MESRHPPIPDKVSHPASPPTAVRAQRQQTSGAAANGVFKLPPSRHRVRSRALQRPIESRLACVNLRRAPFTAVVSIPSTAPAHAEANAPLPGLLTVRA